MKNNKKYDRTFKLSLVAVALSMTNLAWADEVACSPSGVDIIGKNGATLNGCVINQQDLNRWRGKLEITDSPNTTITNVQVSISSGKPSGIRIGNSDVTLNNVTLSANLNDLQNALHSVNSTVNINGGSYKTEVDHGKISETFVLNNSTVNVKNATISLTGSGNEGVFFYKNSTANLENITLTATDYASTLSYEADNTPLSINITNSTLTSDKRAFAGISDWRGDKDTEGKVQITVNNSTLSAPVLMRAENIVYYGYSLTENITFTANNSTLNGRINVYKDEQNQHESTINVNLTDSTWTINGLDDRATLSSVSNLTLNNSVINLKKSDNFQTLTIKGNLTGSGTFNLNTNIAENKGDKIIVEGTAEGNHKLGVTDHGVAVANRKLTLVETNGGNAAFSLTNPNNRVDLGAYQYFLTKEGNNWVLANSQSAVTPPKTPDVKPEMPTPIAPTNPDVQPEIPSTPIEPTNPSVQPETPNIPTVPIAPVIPVQPTNPTLPQTALLSNKANAQVSLRQAQLLLVENELSGIHQRLGEVKNGEKGNVWVRNVNSREKLTALSTGNSQTSGFKQNVHSLQVGADAAVNDNFRLGGFIGRSQADVDFNGNYGEGKVRSNTVGLYATYLANNGIYVDNIVKYSRLKAQSDHTEKHRYNAYTLSSELGKQFKLSGDWIITPQAQLGWTHVQGKENEDNLSSVYSRVGLRAAKSFALANGWNLQPYAEINAITSRNNNSKIHYANAALNVEDSRGRFESILGVNARITNHRFGLEISRADGKRYDKPYQIQALYRYQW
ncbi:hypothetical protein BKK54_02630 [Rodentibacter genomosp. 1]|uniref:Autotransporter domain-containing protein n=1 Tax=Rodentibacter genomosp. 1 TaxID=1908264 RepID=A0A1V3J816_9PAST|nr:autotransporter outer membrane beta-barrel domain-containing protein [Rodentibacter genomosp. 1]OOF51520.1 hypothetical protein BKK54_02630 [Rodentibacter genomosp. 1]